MDIGQNGPIILHVHKLVAVELTFVTGHVYGMTLIHMDQSVMELQMKVIPVIQRLVQVCITLLRQNVFFLYFAECKWFKCWVIVHVFCCCLQIFFSK